MAERNTENEVLKPALYIVPTPIGNREDITLRALKILSKVDIIACEDTRHSGTLLKSYNINPNKLRSYHEHNELQQSEILVAQILSGKNVALITDAGSPSISDPGYRLIKTAIEHNVNIIPLPGPTAFIPALIGSGFPTDEFHFFGFPPQKKGRASYLKKIAEQNSTSIIYESPYKIILLLEELSEICDNTREVCIAREISKIYEEFIRGSLSGCLNYLKSKSSIKGEFVIILKAQKKGN